MKSFIHHNHRINKNLQAISSEQQKLQEKLTLVRDNRLYLEKGYFSFQDYCDSELIKWGGYVRVQELLGEEGGASC